MAKKNSLAIIGISNFSLSVIEELMDKRQVVTVFDINQDKLDLYLSDYDSIEAIVLDSTNKKGLAKNGISSYDAVIVSIGSDMETSLVTVLNLIDLDCQKIIVQAKDEQHKRILLSLGLGENQIIIPDHIAGSVVGARTIFDIDFDIDVQPIDDEFLVTTLTVHNKKIIDKNVQDAGLSRTKEFNIIQLRRNGKIFLVDDYTEIKAEDELVIFAKTTIINKLAEKVQGTTNSNEDNNELKDFEELEALNDDLMNDDITFFNNFDEAPQTAIEKDKTTKK